MSAKCKYCGTEMGRIIGHHLRRCIVASDEERAYYERYRQWPLANGGFATSSEIGATLAQRVGILERSVDLLMDEFLRPRRRRRP